MIALWLDSPLVLLSGLGMGFLFGFLLQRGGVSDANVIIKQFLFTDFTVIKIMLTAIILGAVGFAVLNAYHLIPPAVITAPHLGVIVGGLLFGVGMATLGLCPGTCVAAVGQGSRDAWLGILGMLAGALLFVPLAPWFQKMFISQVISSATTIWQFCSIC
jgi:uncharacterized membrane protein YedE/YeeE